MPEKIATPIKPPRNEHELELRLVRMLGNDNSRMLVMRTMMANAIAGQFLPKGAILKGGGSLRYRFGSSFTRNTIDFDTTRSKDEDSNLFALRLVAPSARPLNCERGKSLTRLTPRRCAIGFDA